VVTNAGGMNPHACAAAVSQILKKAALGDEVIAVVSGDDLLPRLEELQSKGCQLSNMETGQPLHELNKPVVSANAYLGARPITESLAGGARIVITGRVADASLTVGPFVYRYGCAWDNWDLLATATVAGHLIECGAQATGGYSDRWRDLDYVDIGYPIAEFDADGRVIITKPTGSGGIVDRRSITEQLLYEIGDPAAYYTPDVVADFSQVEVRELGEDRVQIMGARGMPAPETLKVSLAYQAGFTATAQLLIVGEHAVEKGLHIGELVFKRLAKIGVTFEQTNIECLGGASSLASKPAEIEPCEIMLRLSVRDSNRAPVERFTYEIAPLITNGPNGIAGYASGRPAVRPVLAYWPTFIPKSCVTSKVEIRSANEWISGS
jgi:hypothetical protein